MMTAVLVMLLNKKEQYNSLAYSWPRNIRPTICEGEAHQLTAMVKNFLMMIGGSFV